MPKKSKPSAPLSPPDSTSELEPTTKASISHPLISTSSSSSHSHSPQKPYHTDHSTPGVIKRFYDSLYITKCYSVPRDINRSNPSVNSNTNTNDENKNEHEHEHEYEEHDPKSQIQHTFKVKLGDVVGAMSTNGIYVVGWRRQIPEPSSDDNGNDKKADVKVNKLKLTKKSEKMSSSKAATPTSSTGGDIEIDTGYMYDENCKLVPIDKWGFTEIICVFTEEVVDLDNDNADIDDSDDSDGKMKGKRKISASSGSEKYIDTGIVMIEMRWFYRRHELEGIVNKTSKNVVDSFSSFSSLSSSLSSSSSNFAGRSGAGTGGKGDTKYVNAELYETDFAEIADAECIICKIDAIHSIPDSTTSTSTQTYIDNDIDNDKLNYKLIKSNKAPPILPPTPSFLVSDYFYAIELKTLSSIKNSSYERVRRGRIYSKYFKGGSMARVKLDEHESVRRAESAAGGAASGSVKEVLTKSKPSSSSCLSSINKQSLSLSSRLQTLMPSLSLSYHPVSSPSCPLVSRFYEHSRILQHLTSSISSNGLASSTLFIAGPPGSGKTATVLSIITLLKEQLSKGEVNPFNFIHINAMELQTPFDVYTKLWEGVNVRKGRFWKAGEKGFTKGPGVAASCLEKYFVGSGVGSSSKNTDNSSNASSSSNNAGEEEAVVVGGGQGVDPINILLLDEIDYLMTKKQTVLYNILDWPTRERNLSSGGLVVIGIANTINLPDRMLPKVQSRLGTKRLFFKSYDVEGINSILVNRLMSVEGMESDSKDRDKDKDKLCFESDALMFAARKTAGFSGDVRKVLEICRVAARKVIDRENEYDEQRRSGADNVPNPALAVTVRDVKNAVQDMINFPMMQCIKECTPFEALLFVSLASLKRQIGVTEGVILKSLYHKMKGVANGIGQTQYLPIPLWGEMVEILNNLAEAKILNLETNVGKGKGRNVVEGTYVILSTDDFELLEALQGGDHRVLAEKHLSASTR